MCQFNKALLAKQSWHLLKNLNSLFSRVLKVKYFPNFDFINANLGTMPSFTWKSIWAAKVTLCSSLAWRVGTGEQILINKDAWIPGAKQYKLSKHIQTMHNCKVTELIDLISRTWKEDMVIRTIQATDATRIFRIPLARTVHDDLQVWQRELSGEFTVRSAYKLLQNLENDPMAYALHEPDMKFYKTMWNLNLPSKLKITLWRIFWNLIPTLVNLQ